MPSPREIVDTPAWYPHQLNVADGRVLLVERSEDNFRAASFLDDRWLRPDDRREIVAWHELADAFPASARRDAQYIFHVGHVGSTLISRLLGELASVFALREPLLLRTFAELFRLGREAEVLPRLDTATALLSRTFRTEQRAMVKASSFVSEIADRLVPPGSRALLLYSPAPRYLENMLAGDASRAEIHALAANRAGRLDRRCGGDGRWDPAGLNEGERAALAWACEMTALQQAACRLGERALWYDFDRFLASPAASLTEVAQFFGCGQAGSALPIDLGPIMSRYSKAPEYEYSPQLRQQVLAESRALNRRAIADGLAWLEQAAKHYPALADCLARAD
jgi:hypothetical protein